MSLTRIEKLEKINAALMERVERSMDQQGNAFSLFQTAIGLEGQVRRRTDELAATLRRLETSNRALNGAKDVAEYASRSKTRFVAAASHDVLQPLNAANLSISALAELQTTEQGKRLVRQVEQSLATMDELLRTLLDISRLDSGALRPEVASVPLNTILASLSADFEPIAAARGLCIKIQPTSAYVLTDPTMLRRILLNIVSNAIRYTTKGGVVVGARRRGDMLSIEVADTGIGIPADQHEIIFEEFHRGATAASRDLGHPAGLGLGLSIVARMVAALGHHISFTSVVGRGTVFRLRVPAGKPCEPPELEADPWAMRPAGNSLFGTKVLVVENDQRVMEAMATLLESWRCSVRMASQTEEALELLGDPDWTPDIILADQQLDDGDFGDDTIEQARQRMQRNLPAIIITADASEELALQTRQNDIQLMRKPLRPAELRALMAHLIAK